MLLKAGAAESWFSVDATSDLLWCFNHSAKSGVTGGVFVFFLCFSHLIFSHSYVGTFTLGDTETNTRSHAQEGMSAKTEPSGSRLSGGKGQVSGPSVFHQTRATPNTRRVHSLFESANHVNGMLLVALCGL